MGRSADSKTPPAAAEAPKQRTQREKRIAAPEETASLRFRDSLRVSIYEELLQDLQDAPNGSTLKITKQARYTAVKHIRHLGLRVQWAAAPDGQHLYIKIVGELENPPLTIESVLRPAPGKRSIPIPPVNSPAATADGMRSEDRMILDALGNGPLTLKELGRSIGAPPTRFASHLSRLAGMHLIEQEDGVYRLNGRRLV